MVFQFEEKGKTLAKLKVVGVGGAGGNAVNRMVQSGLSGVEFIAVNTDAMALEHNQADLKIQIGTKLTSGLGAGANPNVGMMALEEDRDAVKETLAGADMVFIAAGMGGGTGTGAAPVVAELARELGILTVAVVTKPFMWEGPVREKNAFAGLEALRKSVDTMIVVPNQKILSVVEKNTPLRQAFKMADDILTSATRGISEIILKHGDIQVDFADVRAIMSQGGDALMGTGVAAGENRATIAADRAIHSPLLDNVSIAGATGVLVNITGGDDLGIMEVSDAMNYIYEAVGNDSNANIIFGTVINPEMKEEIAITVIATGFGAAAGPAYQQRLSSGARPAGLGAYGAEPSRPTSYGAESPRSSFDAARPAFEPSRPAFDPRPAPEPRRSGPLFPEKGAGFAGAAPGPFDRAGAGESSREAASGDKGTRPVEDVVVPAIKQPYGLKPGTHPAAARAQSATAAKDDDTRFFFNEGNEANRKAAAGGQAPAAGAGNGFAQKGRYKDYDADIDYETPAFLRNQAD